MKLVPGPKEGNLLDPPNITFIPIDKYDNTYFNLFINETIRNLQELDESKKKFIDSLTEGFLNDKKLGKNIKIKKNNIIV